jgi:hypothetical protein
VAAQPAESVAKTAKPTEQKPKSKRTGPSKVSTVQELCSRPSGSTIDIIMERCGVSKVAASSLISDVKRKGFSVRREEVDGHNV